MSRQADRQGLQTPVRVRMLEDDMDRADDQIIHTKNTSRQLIDALRHEINIRLVQIETVMSKEIEEARAEAKGARTESEGQRKILVGLLISMTTAAAAIVVQVLLYRGGK